jgi:hypothetical protein
MALLTTTYYGTTYYGSGLSDAEVAAMHTILTMALLTSALTVLLWHVALVSLRWHYLLQVAVMYGLVDASGEYDEDAVQALQEQLAEAAGQQVTPTPLPLHLPLPLPLSYPIPLSLPLHIPLPLRLPTPLPLPPSRRSSVTAPSTT